MKASKREAIERALIHHKVDYSPPGGGHSTWRIFSRRSGSVRMTTAQVSAYCMGLADKEGK